jgi:hypothetical protein
MGQQSPIMLLNGRLQLLTVSGELRFFADKPPVPDPLGIGRGKEVSRELAEFPPLPTSGGQLLTYIRQGPQER